MFLGSFTELHWGDRGKRENLFPQSSLLLTQNLANHVRKQTVYSFKHPGFGLIFKVLYHFIHNERPMLSVTRDTDCIFTSRKGGAEFMVKSKPLLRGTQFLRVPTKET